LVLEALEERRVRRHPRMQELDRDAAPELGALAPVHHAHSTGADPFQDLIAIVENRADARVVHGAPRIPKLTASARARPGPCSPRRDRYLSAPGGLSLAGLSAAGLSLAGLSAAGLSLAGLSAAGSLGALSRNTVTIWLIVRPDGSVLSRSVTMTRRLFAVSDTPVA